LNFIAADPTKTDAARPELSFFHCIITTVFQLLASFAKGLAAGVARKHSLLSPVVELELKTGTGAYLAPLDVFLLSRISGDCACPVS
jgi:hypothetical protein